MQVDGPSRKRGRPKGTWMVVVRTDMMKCIQSGDLAQDRLSGGPRTLIWVGRIIINWKTQSFMRSIKQWAPILLLWNFSIYSWRVWDSSWTVKVISKWAPQWSSRPSRSFPDMELITFPSCTQLNCGTHLYWNDILGCHWRGLTFILRFGLSFHGPHNGFPQTYKSTYNSYNRESDSSSSPPNQNPIF